MSPRLLRHLIAAGRRAARACRRRLLTTSGPLTTPLIAGTLADLVHSKPELLAKKALLRQQLVIVKRPCRTPADRALLVLLAGRVRT